MPALPLLLAAHGGVGGATPDATYSGARRETDVRPPRVEGAPAVTVDGRLDEPEWARAAVLTGFSQYAPTDGVPAADSTRVLVWYSATAIHFGVRAYEAHAGADGRAAVHATLADRDRIAADDNVQLLLGTSNDGRQATVLAVNPLGVQADGEGGGGRRACLRHALAASHARPPASGRIAVGQLPKRARGCTRIWNSRG